MGAIALRDDSLGERLARRHDAPHLGPRGERPERVEADAGAQGGEPRRREGDLSAERPDARGHRSGIHSRHEVDVDLERRPRATPGLDRRQSARLRPNRRSSAKSSCESILRSAAVRPFFHSVSRRTCSIAPGASVRAGPCAKRPVEERKDRRARKSCSDCPRPAPGEIDFQARTSWHRYPWRATAGKTRRRLAAILTPFAEAFRAAHHSRSGERQAGGRRPPVLRGGGRRRKMAAR